MSSIWSRIFGGPTAVIEDAMAGLDHVQRRIDRILDDRDAQMLRADKAEQRAAVAEEEVRNLRDDLARLRVSDAALRRQIHEAIELLAEACGNNEVYRELAESYAADADRAQSVTVVAAAMLRYSADWIESK